MKKVTDFLFPILMGFLLTFIVGCSKDSDNDSDDNQTGGNDSEQESPITLTKDANTPRIGDSFTYIAFTSVSPDVANGGENQVWDFSSFTNGTEVTYNYVAPSSSPNASNFQQVDIVEQTLQQSVLNEMFYSTASGLTIQGLYSPGAAEWKLIDGREFVKFPLSYNSTAYNETFRGDFINTQMRQTFDRKGTVTMEVDGYGDLKLPYGTVEDVLRVKVTSNYTDTYMGSEILAYRDVVYLWYNATTRNYVANYNLLYTSNEFMGEMLMSSTLMYISENSIK